MLQGIHSTKYKQTEFLLDLLHYIGIYIQKMQFYQENTIYKKDL